MWSWTASDIAPPKCFTQDICIETMQKNNTCSAVPIACNEKSITSAIRHNETKDSTPKLPPDNFIINSGMSDDNLSQKNHTANVNIKPTVQVDYKVATLFLLPTFAISPIVGACGDAFGYSILLLSGLLASTTTTLIYAFRSGVLAIYIGRLLHDIGSACFKPAIFGSIYTIYPPSTSNGKNLIGIIMACNAFSYFGPGLCGILLRFVGQMVALLSFVPFEIMLTIFVLLTFNIVKKSRKELMNENESDDHISEFDDKLSDSDDDNIMDPLINDDPESMTSPFTDAKPAANEIKLYKILCNYKMLILSLTTTVAFIPKAALQPVLSIWLTHRYSSDTATSGIYWGVAGISSLAASFISTNFSQHYPNHILLYTAINLALISVPFILIPILPSVYASGLCFTSYIYFADSARFGAVTILSQLAETEFKTSYGRVMGMYNFGSKLPYFMMPFPSIMLYNTIGFKNMCIVIAPMALLWSPLLFLVRRTDKEKNCPQSEDKDSSKVTINVPICKEIRTSSMFVQQGQRFHYDFT